MRQASTEEIARPLVAAGRPADAAGSIAAPALPAPLRLRGARPPLARLLHFTRTKKLGALGLALLVLFAFIALFGQQLAPQSPVEIQREVRLQAPSAGHWFGTDLLGRDIFSRTLVGARLSILVGITVAALIFTLGTALGISSAYFGGKYDMLLQRFIDALSAFPTLVLAIAIMSVAGQSIGNVVLALTITSLPRHVRVMRSQALSVQNMMYVEAARAMGASHLRAMVYHVAPNCMATAIVITTAAVGGVILAESSLSFLGVGTPDDVISWGSMLSGSQQRYFATAPWIGIFPGLALSLVVFGFNTFGDALRDVMDPRLRRGA